MRRRALTHGHAVGPGTYFVATLGLVYLFVILAQLPGASRRGDFSIYYACAVATDHGLDSYAINLTDFTRELGLEPDPFTHPNDTPAFTLVTTPLAIFSVTTAYVIWFVASALCLIASLYLLFGSAQLNRMTTMLLCLAVLAFTPLADNIRWAQSQVFVMVGILLFFRLLQHGNDCAAAILLAALGLLRGFPLVLGGYLIARRRWRAIVVLAIAFALGAGATIAAMGVVPVENFLHVIGIVGSHPWFSLDPRWEIAAANVSLDAFVARPLMLSFGADLPRDLFLISRAIVLCFKTLVLVLAFRTTASVTDDQDGRAFSLWVATMLILIPVVWLHYMTLLIIPLGLIAVAAIHREIGAHVWRFAMVVYCVIVLTTPLMSTLTFRKDIFDWRAGAMAEIGFLALLSAWIAVWRFASETFSESESAADRLKAAARS